MENVLQYATQDEGSGYFPVPRIPTAMQHKRQGQRISGRIRFGWDLEADGITLVENPDEQRVLELIDELKEAGESLRAIAAELTRRGIPTKEGRTEWKHSTVAGIISRAA